LGDREENFVRKLFAIGNIEEQGFFSEIMERGIGELVAVFGNDGGDLWTGEEEFLESDVGYLDATGDVH